MDSLAAPTSSATSTRTTCVAATAIFCRMYFLNPAAVTVMCVGTGGHLRNRVVAGCGSGRLVDDPRFRVPDLNRGVWYTAPAGSVTVPVMVPRSPCPNATDRTPATEPAQIYSLMSPSSSISRASPYIPFQCGHSSRAPVSG